MRYFELAKRLTQSADHHQHRIGSVIVKKNRVISVGYNLLKTSPKSTHPYFSSHSEMRAIWGVSPEDLKGSTIYIFRQNREGFPARAYPCQYCLELIKASGIKRIYYTDYNSYAMEEIA
jgi:deoxycytidylate deaminase